MAPTKNPKRRPPAKTLVAHKAHPSNFNSHAYAVEMREVALDLRARGVENDPEHVTLRNMRKLPSKRSARRWANRAAQQGGRLERFRRSGNKPATIFKGADLFRLAYYRMAFPKALHAEINTFLFNSQLADGIAPDDRRIYDVGQISRAEDELGLSRKRASTVARQVNTRVNRWKAWMVANLPYPYGVADIKREDLIDLDEAGFSLESATRHYGKAFIGHDAATKDRTATVISSPC